VEVGDDHFWPHVVRLRKSDVHWLIRLRLLIEMVRIPLRNWTSFSAAAPRTAMILMLAAMLQPARTAAVPPDSVLPGKPSPLLSAMQAELDRSFKVLSQQDPAAYFIGYTITDTQRAEVSGSNGALLSSSEARNRWLQVSVRTGDYNLDNTHKVGEQRMPSGGPGTGVPGDNHEQIGRRANWLGTDSQKPNAAQ